MIVMLTLIVDSSFKWTDESVNNNFGSSVDELLGILGDH